MRIEWDFVKKLLRTLPGNRCKVRAHEGVAKPIPHNGHGQSVQGLSERSSALDVRTGGSPQSRHSIPSVACLTFNLSWFCEFTR